jgi:hypothetical protein
MPKKYYFSNSGNKSIVVLIIVAAFLAGYFLGAMLGFGRLNISGKTPVASCPSYGQAVEAVKNKIISSGSFGKGGVTSFTGMAISVKDDKVVFSTSLPSPVLDDSLKTRTAVITNNTVIVLRKIKSTEQAKKDNQEGAAALADLEKRVQALKQTVSLCDFSATSTTCAKAKTDLDKAATDQALVYNNQLPSTYVYNGKPSDLTGNIQVVAYSDSDILEKATFDATKIELTEIPADPFATK